MRQNVKIGRTRGAAAAALAATMLLAACGADDGGSTGSGDETVELTVATFAQPDSVGEAVSSWFYEEVEARSDGRLTFDVTAPDSLCAANEIAVCVQDGRADLGVTIPDYTPQMFPTVTLISVPFLTEDSQALMQTLHQLNGEHEGAQQVWEDNGLTPIAHFSAGRLVLGSEEPIESIADMAGLRWRVSGAYLQRAIEAAGGSNVAVTAPETYEAIERGLADTVGFPIDGATQYQLMELLPYWTDPGSGHYTTIGMWMNRDVYEGLPDDLRAVVDEVTDELNSGEGVLAFNEVAAELCNLLEDNATDLGMWGEAATEEWRAAIGDELLDQWAQDATAAGLEDAEGYREAYLDLLGQHDGSVPDPTLECVAQFAAN